MEKQKDKAAQRVQRKLFKQEGGHLGGMIETDELAGPLEPTDELAGPLEPTEPSGETTPTE
jgi:hypothetical protein